MNTFILELNDLSQAQHFDVVSSFVGRDSSGSFGLRAGHETFVTCLQPGLARFQLDDKDWYYIAQPGAVLLFQDNRLKLATTQCIVSHDRETLLEQMEQQWQQVDQQLGDTQRTLRQMDQALARKIWEMTRSGSNLGDRL